MRVSTWFEGKTRHICQRIIVEGDLVLQTPTHFGNGDGDEITDMPLLLDPYDNQSPLLTGASLAGALRGYLRERQHGYEYRLEAIDESKSILLFGGLKANPDGDQSPLIVADSLGRSDGKVIRAGVRLDGKTRTAVDKALFDVQLWQAGTTFPLRFELLIGPEDDASAMKQALVTALDGLSNGRITLGARKRRGYGAVKVEQWCVQIYDLTQPAQLCAWIRDGNDALPVETAVVDLKKSLGVENLLDDNRQQFHMQASFALQGSLLIRSGQGQDDTGPDMVHLHARQPNGQMRPILSGTSLTGVLRARAQRIANTIKNGEQADRLITQLFGGEYQDKGQNRLRASRLTVKETVVKNGRSDLVQSRVSIDRFTGGARETALFDQQPVFAKEETIVTIDLHLQNPEKHDVGLLLLLLKDLWTEDLPFGGESSVGRGRLQGRQANLMYQNGELQEWIITAVAPNKLNFEQGDPKKLHPFVNALHTELTRGQS